MNTRNAVLETIRARRSVRSFDGTPVDKHLIEEVVAAGNWAASAGNRQSWRFVVIQQPELIATLQKEAKPHLQKRMEATDDQSPVAPFLTGPYAESRGWTTSNMAELRARIDEDSDPVFYKAPVIVVVVGTGPGMELNCAAACQNMLLAAQSLDLASAWIISGNPAFEEPTAAAAIELSEGEKAFATLLLGHAALVPNPPPKKPPQVKWV